MPTQLDGDITGEATKVTVQVDPRSLLIRVRALPGIGAGGVA
jgi:hypothetical protein